MTSISGLAHQLLLLTPQFLVLSIFLVVSLVRWNRHPGASALALVGSIVLMIEAGGSTALWNWLPQSPWYQSMSPTEMERFSDIFSVVDSIVTAVGIGFCFLGVFVGRNKVSAAFPAAFPMNPPLATRMGPPPSQPPPPPLPLPPRQ